MSALCLHAQLMMATLAGMLKQARRQHMQSTAAAPAALFAHLLRHQGHGGLAQALSQAAMFLCSIRFLRDDLDRVFRVDRAQITLLLSRYLTDFSWRLQIEPDTGEVLGREVAGRLGQRLSEAAPLSLSPRSGAWWKRTCR